MALFKGIKPKMLTLEPIELPYLTFTHQTLRKPGLQRNQLKDGSEQSKGMEVRRPKSCLLPCTRLL